MKPAEAKDPSYRHLLGMIAAGLITVAVLLVLIGSGWTVWKFVMGLLEDNWPEWLSLCGVK